MSLGPGTKGPTRRRGVGRIGGEIVDELNGLKPGLGTRLAADLNRKFSGISSHLNRAVVLSEDKIDMSEEFGITGLPEPEHETDPVTLGFFYRWFKNCRWFVRMAENCLQTDEERQASVGDGLVHAFWNYTYEIPNFTDTIDNDPGVLEGGFGTYCQIIIPSTTTVDRVSFWITDTPVNAGPIRFGLFDLNRSASAFPLLAQSASLEAVGAAVGRHTRALDTRLTVAAGVYAVALIAPCFNMYCVKNNLPAWRLVNDLWTGNGGLLPGTSALNRYGTFTTDGTMPAALSGSNAAIVTNSNPPLAYFDDSQVFAS